MKTNCFLALICFSFFHTLTARGQNCNNWLKLPSHSSYVQVGDIDVVGNQLTVEATFVRSSAFDPSFNFGKLVSKHTDATNVNYSLMPVTCEITTTKGYVNTPITCLPQLNKTYHVAMVYDGATLKFYRDGFLLSSVAWSGNLVNNDFLTTIGQGPSLNDPTYQHFGYINEVRIWNVARTQAQIQAYMNQALPSPQTTSGLLAYYTFDNLLNKQGNAAWNASLGGSATINETNPNCSFAADSCGVLKTNTVTPGFTAPDTVCVNAPVSITNTSIGASSYYWNFCVADVNTPPSGFNLGNVGGKLNTPVYMDYVFDNGNYYGFVTNNYPGGLLRMDFGNSLLNTPTVTDLGMVGGVIPYNTEGIQIVKNEGKWYLIIVGGDNVQPVPNPAVVVKIELGANIQNNSPVGTSWGNIGNLAYPHDLYVFDDNGHWYGLTVNTDNSTITKFDFTTSFSNTPTAVNLGNIGNLNSPTGIYALKDNGNWYAFVTNATSSTLTRLDFGASLLNTPTGTNLGNIGGKFQTCWDVQIMKYCGQNIGFVINASGNDLIKLDFGNSISNTPSALSFGNTGNLSFPHCLSKIFRVGPDLHTFVANVNNNTLTRIKFTGCSSSSIPSSSAQTPAAVSYSTPGSYNINLTVDDGLPTQAAFCKQVVVLAPPTSTTLDLSVCPGNSINLNPTITGATNFLWSPASGLSSSNIQNPIASPSATTQYTLTASNAPGCTSNSTVTVKIRTPQECATVTPSFTVPDTVCVNTAINLTNTSTGASSYYWNFCTANINKTPIGMNFGNPGGQLTTPCFIDYAYENGNWYGFITSNNPPSLVRLEFGSSLLNSPTAVNLGNFGGMLPYGAQGIQLVQESGNWYAFITGGDSVAVPGQTSRILKLEIGPSLTNNNPMMTNWGNIGGLSYPTDLYMFKDADTWYGFTLNYYGGTMTRFNFGSNFSLPPTGTNLGNLGILNLPSGICPVKDNNGVWRVFVANFGGNTLSRIDFGNSLLNAPTSSVNLGSLGGLLHNPRDLYIFNYCNESVGFLINETTNDLVRLNFNSLSSIPIATSLGNVAGFKDPHSISKLFRAGSDLFAFVPNSYVNTVSRIQFQGCNNASNPNSTLQNPPAIVYDSPGAYNINLMVDEGLPTQAAFCKQVVVLPAPIHSPTKNFTICPGGSIKIGSSIKPANYQWNTGETADSISISSTGLYWVESDRYGCSVRDSFIVSAATGAATQVFNSDTTIFAGDVVQLNSYSPLGVYNWSPVSNLNCSNCSHPIASPLVSTTYVLTGTNSCGTSKDSVRINVINRATAQCYGFQTGLGLPSFERGYDVAASTGDEFFVVGITKTNGNDDILVSKMNLEGTVIWSKIIGGSGAESIRKISSASDGGVLVTGQSKSFGNSNGDILCFKISASGSLVWSRKYGVGSPNGDLGMDLIETADGGYALSGILNVAGGVADAVVIKMDNNANIVWTRRFDNSSGEDGVGIVQKGDTLIITTDIETASGNYNFVITKLNLSDGAVFASKKLSPASRGLFNPYIYKNPAAPGYIISGHTIDLNNYANMQHTIITVDDNLNIVNTKLISVNPATNDFYTAFIPLPDGSFVGAASPQTNSDGYVYRIAGNNSVMYAKKFNGLSDRRIYRMVAMGQEAIAVGGTITNGQEDFFVANFKKDGSLGFTCDVQDAIIAVQQPNYSAAIFTWPFVTDVSFPNNNVALNISPVLLLKNEVCPKPPIDFGFQQNMCFPKTVQFTSNLTGVQSYLWNFGNGQTNNSNVAPSITYANYGTYDIKLNVQYLTGCVDSLVKTVTIDNSYDKTVIVNSDTTICLGDSILLKTTNSISNYCWKSSGGIVPTLVNTYVKPLVPTTYTLTSRVIGANLIVNSDFSLGNTGFTSGYNFTNLNTTEGQYGVGASSISWNSNMSNCHDHSSGSGNMLMINGSPIAGIKVWSQTVTVTPNTDYNFSIWISSLHSSNPGNLYFAVNNAGLGNNISAGSSTCQWKQFSSTWNSGSNTSATISIVNNNTIIDGNDFALDDIFFGQVSTKTDSITVDVVGLCDSVKIIGADKVCSSTDTLTYSIYKSPNCTQQYSMEFDNAFATIVSQTPTSLKLLFKKNGTTTIKVAYTNNCKIVADSLNVSVKFSPASLNLGPDIITCRDTALVINAGDGFVSYLWQDGSKDSIFKINAPGNYSVTTQNLCGAQLKDTIRLIKSLVTPFTVSPLDATVCQGDSVQFKASGGTIYSWSPSANFGSPAAASTKALVNASQNFTVSISDLVCNRDTTIIIPVIAKPGANISVAKSNDVNCSNDSAILIANGGVSYTWAPNLYISRNNGSKITVKPYQNTTYTVRGKDAIGCYGVDSVTVYFFKEGNQKLFTPTAFTPNGDGKNDLFRPSFIGPSARYDFRIYNRWGQLVFQSKTPGVGWDGTVNGIPQKADVYVFYLTARGECNGDFVQKGTFALIR